MDVFEAIHKRRAVRKYLPDPVPKTDIHTLLDAANWAPSAMNRQQWDAHKDLSFSVMLQFQPRLVLTPHLPEQEQ